MSFGISKRRHGSVPEVLPEEKVIDLLPDEGPESEKLSVYSVQHRLEEVSLARVFGVEELEKLEHELLVDDLLADARLEIGRLEEPEEEFVHKLEKTNRSSLGGLHSTEVAYSLHNQHPRVQFPALPKNVQRKKYGCC